MLVLGLVAYQFSTSSSLTASSTDWTTITNTKSEITKTYSASSNGTYYFYVKDSAGNINKANTTVAKIDKTKPTITTPSASNQNHDGFTITTTFNDQNSGLSKIVVYYKKTNETSYKTKTTTYTTTNGATAGAIGSQTKDIVLTGLSDGKTYNVYVVGYDVAGNSVQSSTITVTKPIYVAQIGSTKYETLAEAISKVESNQSSDTTITMLNNTSESVTITKGKSIILNLNGKTITGNMKNQGKLTISGSGTLTATGGVTLTNELDLYIKGATITATGTLTSDRRAIMNTYMGDIYMSSGTVTTSLNTRVVENNGKFYLSGGTINLDNTGNGSAFYNTQGFLKITDSGKVTSKSHAVAVDGGFLLSNGGTISSSSNTYPGILIRNLGLASCTSTTITNSAGGTAIKNERGSGWVAIFRSRGTNYQITGKIAGYVIATTNTGPGQNSEKVTIYNPGTTSVRYNSWHGDEDSSLSNLDVVNQTFTGTTSSITGTVNKPAHDGKYFTDLYGSGYLGTVELFFNRDNPIHHENLPISGRTYKICSAMDTSMVMDVYNSGTANNTNVQLYKWSNTNNQKWIISVLSDGNYKIINKNANKSSDVTGGSTASGANVAIYDWNNSNAQLWTFDDAYDGFYYIKAAKLGTYLDSNGGVPNNGSNIMTYSPLHGGDNQRWRFDEVDRDNIEYKEPISFDIKVTNITSTSYDVIVSNAIAESGIKQVRVPTWSNNRGQDDISWITAEKQSDGTYKAHIDRSNFVDSGIFTSHVYVDDNSGNTVAKNAGTVKLYGYGPWYGDGTYYTTRVWTRLSDYNGVTPVYSIDILWRYQQDAGNNRTQVEAAQVRFNQHVSGWGMAGCPLYVGLGIGGNNGTASTTISGNPPNSFTLNLFKYATITHNSSGAFTSQIQWQCYVNSADSHRPTFSSWQYFTPSVRAFDSSAIGEPTNK